MALSVDESNSERYAPFLKSILPELKRFIRDLNGSLMKYSEPKSEWYLIKHV